MCEATNELEGGAVAVVNAVPTLWLVGRVAQIVCAGLPSGFGRTPAAAPAPKVDAHQGGAVVCGGPHKLGEYEFIEAVAGCGGATGIEEIMVAGVAKLFDDHGLA